MAFFCLARGVEAIRPAGKPNREQSTPICHTPTSIPHANHQAHAKVVVNTIMDTHDRITTAPGHIAQAPITPREHLNFDFSGDIPRHWLAGDVFKTRFFDAMSTLFPEGERFFIACVRDYKDQVTDPAQQQIMLDFAKQEAQHTRFHRAYNQRLAEQGVKVDQ
jgi:hypothetical protein